MKALPVTGVVLALALALGVVATVHKLSDFTPYLEEGVFTLDEIAAGHVHHVVFNRRTWVGIPSALGHVPILAFINLRAFVVMGPLVVGAWLLWRRKGWQDYGVAGLVVLFSSAVPWTLGLIILCGNTDLYYAGPWVGMMVIGLFYACMACAGFSAYELYRSLRGKRAAVSAPAAA